MKGNEWKNLFFFSICRERLDGCKGLVGVNRGSPMSRRRERSARDNRYLYDEEAMIFIVAN
jgi:hypothetical protein